MTTHDDLLHAAALAQAEHPGELEYLFAEKMLAAAEPIIRADERERILSELEGPARESEAMYAHAESIAARLVEVICRLDRWKREALTVLAEWDEVHTALGSPGRLGESKAGAARAEATRLRAEVRHIARAEVRERIAQAIEAAMESHLNCPHPECAQSYRDAACIARGEQS